MNRHLVKIFFLGVLVGCSSQKGGKAEGDTALDKELGSGADEINAQKKFERVEVLAFGRDGFPKVKRTDEDQMIKFEVDFNGDGRIDYIQKVRKNGDWVEEESIDFDGDGHFDLTNKYAKNLSQKEPILISQELDAALTGNTNVWKTFKDGKLVRREIDLKGFGKPNYRETYDQMKLVKVEKDENLESGSDSKLQIPQALKTEGPEPGKTPPQKTN